MTLQFTWQGCDSLLAAPLVLDLVRFVELSHRRGEVGVLRHLGSFFKQPIGIAEHDFSRQFALLCKWAEEQSK
jgi:myo-inositol-1-phosphate synthase